MSLCAQSSRRSQSGRILNSGFYRGKVIARSDSKHGRVKLWIPGVYPEEWESTPENLPDAEPAMPLFGGCNNGNGMFSYPNINSIVWCFFANDDQNFPVYFAATYGGTDASGQFDTCTQLPNAEDGAYVHKICAGRTTVLLAESGNFMIETRTIDDAGKPNNVTINGDQSGNLKIDASTCIDISTNEIRLRAFDKMSFVSPRIEMTTTGGKGPDDTTYVIVNTNSMSVNTNGGNFEANTRQGSSLI